LWLLWLEEAVDGVVDGRGPGLCSADVGAEVTSQTAVAEGGSGADTKTSVGMLTASFWGDLVTTGDTCHDDEVERTLHSLCDNQHNIVTSTCTGGQVKIQ
jgi:hypothetical protein